MTRYSSPTRPTLTTITLTAIFAATPSQIHARIDPIATTGGSIPVGTGTLNTFDDRPALNDNGQVIFNASLIATPGGSSDDSAIYIGTAAASPLSQIVREGDAPQTPTVSSVTSSSPIP